MSIKILLKKGKDDHFRGQNKIFFPSNHEILAAVQIDCTDWHYLCIKFY